MARLELKVVIASQIIEVLNDNAVLCSYSVSTSKFGTGSQEGSLKTPLGTFEVCEKHGENHPLNTVFKARKPRGEWSPEGSNYEGEDLILTRILRLRGLDKHNENTFQRFIYIHGTNEEDLIGSPASHGCIRMRRNDVAALFEIIPIGTRTRISTR